MLCKPLLKDAVSGSSTESLDHQIDYLCAMGTYGDMGTTFAFPPPWPTADMKACTKKWTKKCLTDVVSLLNARELSHSRPWRLQLKETAARRTATYDVESAWNVSTQHGEGVTID